MKTKLLDYWKSIASIIVSSLVIGAFAFQLVASASELAATNVRVAALEQSFTEVAKSIASALADRIAQIEGKIAVLKFIATNGGLSEGQKLEYESLKERLKRLK